MKTRAGRPYRMVARADAAAATAERILDAAVDVFWEAPSQEVSLEEVARRAGVTVQTVIRRFGGRAGLISAAGARESEKVRAERSVAADADPGEAIRILVEHYERTGDRVLKMLAEEHREAKLAEIADGGRQTHRRWCEEVFASALARVRPNQRARRLAQLVAVCDVYTWKLLRRDAGLTREQTELALLELLHPLLEETK